MAKLKKEEEEEEKKQPLCISKLIKQIKRHPRYKELNAETRLRILNAEEEGRQGQVASCLELDVEMPAHFGLESIFDKTPS